MKNLSLSVIPADDFQILDILLLGNGIIDPKELPSVQLPPELSMSRGIVICGRAPIWLYTYLTHLCHPSPWIAVYDPRHGAIVIEAHRVDAPPVGTICQVDSRYLSKQLSTEKRSQHTSSSFHHRAVAIIGPPHSGKSVLVYSLVKRLRNALGEEGQREVFVLRACPDGEGDWFVEGDPQLVKILRYKGSWNEEFVGKVVEDIEKLQESKRVLLVDCGGKIDRYNQRILNACTSCIIVTRKGDVLEMKQWEGAALCCNLQLLAWIQSTQQYVSKKLTTDPPSFLIGKLERHAEPPEIPSELLQLFLE
ncbi:CRISPR-associated protein Csx3 [Methylacidiphilum caldifontis]|uniref:CRISPR-associated ring nuclease Crn3/Csx3 n=1 Tax=Methylacidiphilum caldifontis TaxID=2795386 RepID=UPI001A8CC469|nr:CRISPR-associated ring nuclease Crn3/Csx3 [Methylacidiphilum caldifontis]QSR89288.1 CRISPR-associated protein Csx3 [Methylacidiphilum caldifontis]